MRLVLASTSPYRRELLERLGVPFEVAAPWVDETLAANEAPEKAVRRLALAKAQAVAARETDALVLASDQLASLADEPLGKPGTAANAVAQLRAMAGATVTYCTAVAVIAPGFEDVEELDLSRVTLRRPSQAEIERYVDRARPLDCAGSLKLEGAGIALCKRIETNDPTALIGLPLIATARLLRERGFDIP